MKLCKIVNQLSTSVTIEDLKVQLPGPGSERTVSSEKADLSSDLDRKIRAGEVKRFPVIPPTSMSVWPFPKAQGKPEKLIGKPKEEFVGISESPSEISSLKTEISELSKRLEQMIGLVEQGVSSLAHNNAQALVNPQYQASQRQKTSTVSDFDEPDPLFIPSKIVPDKTRGRINVKSETEDKGNFEAAKKSLGAARKQAAKKS